MRRSYPQGGEQVRITPHIDGMEPETGCHMVRGQFRHTSPRPTTHTAIAHAHRPSEPLLGRGTGERQEWFKRKPCLASMHAVGDHPAFRALRARRRSRSDIPPHTPNRSGAANAYSRHSRRTSHPAQIAFASATSSPRSVKNTAESTPLQFACAVQGRSSVRSNSRRARSTRIEFDQVPAVTGRLLRTRSASLRTTTTGRALRRPRQSHGSRARFG